MIVSKLIISLVALLGAGTALALGWQMRNHSLLRAEADRQSQDSTSAIRRLEQQVATRSKQLADAETRVSELLKAAKTATATKPQSSVLRNGDAPIDALEIARLAVEKGTSLSKEGKSQEALDIYLKAYRAVQPVRAGSPACQRLMSAIKHLSRTFPPALTALERLRDDTMAMLQEQPARRGELSFEIALLNGRLEQGDRTLALYDALAPGDIGRGSLAMVARDAFIKAQRYNDALLGKPFGLMCSVIDTSAPLLNAETDPSRHAMIRKAVIDQTLTNIEVLAGAGKSDETRRLTEILLAFDGSQTTRSRLEQHLTRAKTANPE